MNTKTAPIIWTLIDEAPALATYSFLPIVAAFTRGTGVSVETRDISLAGRIVAAFDDLLPEPREMRDVLVDRALGVHAERGDRPQVVGECRQRPTSSSCRTSRRRSPS